MAGFALDDESAVTQFEDGIRSLVESGHGARALAMVHRAALANGLDELARLIDPKTIHPALDPPEQLLRECTEFAGLAGDGGRAGRKPGADRQESGASAGSGLAGLAAGQCGQSPAP